MEKEVATLAGGCLWCTEAVFSIVKGVEKVEPGYSCDFLPNPTYEQFSERTTRYAEAVQKTFDTNMISFKEILEIFFASHDPTTLDCQGPDVGIRYCSVIFYHKEEQRATAERIIEELNKAGMWDSPIVTQIEPFKTFYVAEDYHKDYYKRHPNQPYCQQIITPKLAKLQQRFIGKNSRCPRERNGEGFRISDLCLGETV